MATASQEKKKPELNESNSELGPKLWATANALRGNIDAAEYKHVVLPLMFLKYISDAFEGNSSGLGGSEQLTAGGERI